MTAKKAAKDKTHDEQPLRHEDGSDVKGSIRAAEITTDETAAKEKEPMKDSGLNTVSTDSVAQERPEYPLEGKLEHEPVRIQPNAGETPLGDTYFVEAPPSHPANGQHLRIDLKLEGVKRRYNELFGESSKEVRDENDAAVKADDGTALSMIAQESESQRRALTALAEEKLAEGRGDAPLGLNYRSASQKAR